MTSIQSLKNIKTEEETRLKTKDLLIETQGPVLYLTLNRLDQLNAFSPEIITAMKQSLPGAKNNAFIRVISLKGSGRTFSAGGDIKRMGSRGTLETHDHIGNMNDLIMLMSQQEKPIIIAVHGYAVGAGFNLSLAAD
ncbi:enoyl-CoA hydratase/isomerase family protein [Peribacillus butanolivorans]|uniref:enoyl-CoA hydratase/isomerase family protein n=1 Tax=Peribacillus butanolivorans TaxID=421767 RepID=UPI003655BE35